MLCLSRKIWRRLLQAIGNEIEAYWIFYTSLKKHTHFRPIKPKKAMAIIKIKIIVPIDQTNTLGDL